MSLVEGGNVVAFAALYERHSSAAYSLAFRTMGEKQDSVDLTQDAFLKVWRSAGTYRAEKSGVRTWILSVVRNRGIDRLRSQAASRRDRLLEALEALPHEQHEILALAHFSGLTHPEIAERQAQALGTVKGRMRLGLKKLRDHPEHRGWRPRSRRRKGGASGPGEALSRSTNTPLEECWRRQPT